MKGLAPSAAQSIRRVRESLPAEAFHPNAHRLWILGVHAAVILGGYAVIRVAPALAPLAALLIGHSLACVAFVAHDLSHNAVVRHRGIKYGLSLLTLGINAIPPTMWNRLHNDAHHGHANTIEDPDRPFIEHERGKATTAYSALFFPSRCIWRGNVFVLVHFVTYIARNVVTVFYPSGTKPSIMTSKPSYRRRERFVIAMELIAIAALQYGVWIAAGRSLGQYLWASPAPLCVASAVIMAYVFTNHFLNPIAHEHDPITGSTSVIVPKVFDRLHCNFSYHTEHHLFPSLNSDYYPLVSEALLEVAPDRYQQIPFGEAWRRLWEQEQFRKVITRASTDVGPR